MTLVDLGTAVIHLTLLYVSLYLSVCLCVSRWMSDSVLDDITVDIIRQYPNTYTFTKAIAERLLLDERGHVPAVIFRPSIVSASLKEPISVSCSRCAVWDSLSFNPLNAHCCHMGTAIKHPVPCRPG